MFSLDGSQPPKCLIRLENFDPNCCCCRQMRNGELWSLTLLWRRGPKITTKSSHPAGSYAIQIAALLDPMLAPSRTCLCIPGCLKSIFYKLYPTLGMWDTERNEPQSLSQGAHSPQTSAYGPHECHPVLSGHNLFFFFLCYTTVYASVIS